MAAKKKYYGVKKGKVTGIFQSWEECKSSVEGFAGAQFKGFATLEEAREYLGISAAEEVAGTLGTDMEVKQRNAKQQDISGEGRLLAYVDGSYEDSIKKYAFGCIFILSDGRIYVEYGNGDNPKSLQHRNVTGEMLGAMYAVKTAMMNGYSAIEICYDYEGIEKWVTGVWRSKTELTQKYAQSMREWAKSIQITFTKVAAHSNVKYNELADQMAKKGLTQANGVPKVKKLEEMELYGTNTTE